MQLTAEVNMRLVELNVRLNVTCNILTITIINLFLNHTPTYYIYNAFLSYSLKETPWNVKVWGQVMHFVVASVHLQNTI